MERSVDILLGKQTDMLLGTDQVPDDLLNNYIHIRVSNPHNNPVSLVLSLSSTYAQEKKEA